MTDARLLIRAATEQPAWDIPLHSGQQYIGRDDREDGSKTLIIDLGDYSHPTRDQKDYLNRQGLDWHVSPTWAAPETRLICTWEK